MTTDTGEVFLESVEGNEQTAYVRADEYAKQIRGNPIYRGYLIAVRPYRPRGKGTRGHRFAIFAVIEGA